MNKKIKPIVIKVQKHDFKTNREFLLFDRSSCQRYYLCIIMKISFGTLCFHKFFPSRVYSTKLTVVKMRLGNSRLDEKKKEKKTNKSLLTSINHNIFPNIVFSLYKVLLIEQLFT